MKKIIMILALTLTITSSFAFTGREAVNSQTLNTFNSEFVGATDATWTISKSFYKVSFTMNGQILSAYYSKSGEFMAVSQNISSVQLPGNLKKSLKKFLTNSWITNLFEVTNFNETSLYVTLETADTKLVLRSDNGGKWIVFQRIEK